ncbi:hypothetical protein D3C76_158220 [compost metagenome]
MQGLSDATLLASWETVLEVQTRILGPQELKWLTIKGAFEGNVLEVGSGNGCYGSFLAESVPTCNIFGLEANQHLVELFSARSKNLPANYKVEKCRVGVDAIPESVRGGIVTSLLRFILQHSSDPVRVLKHVYDVLPPGGRVYIVEEDDRLFMSNSNWRSFNQTIDIWKRVCAAGGTNSKIGLDLPNIVNSAGFSIEDYTLLLRNNVEMGDSFIELFSSIAIMMCHTNPALIAKGELQQILDQFAASREHHATRHVATYPQVLLVATKPMS